MTRYLVDQSHTTVAFTVRHAGIGKTHGSFGAFEGVIDIPNLETLEGASTQGSIVAASVDTHNDDRDKHLRSADFFNVEDFPTWTFASTSLEGSPAEFTMTGDLTIRDVTRPITLEVEFTGEALDPFGASRIAFEATGTISRKEYGLTWNAALEAGGVLVGDKISLTLDVEAVKQA